MEASKEAKALVREIATLQNDINNLFEEQDDLKQQIELNDIRIDTMVERCDELKFRLIDKLFTEWF